MGMIDGPTLAQVEVAVKNWLGPHLNSGLPLQGEKAQSSACPSHPITLLL